MRPDAPIRLLLATPFPEVEEGVRRSLDQAGLHAEVQVCPSARELLAALERGARHIGKTPDAGEGAVELLLLDESGLPPRTVDALRGACSRISSIPILLLGSSVEDRSRLHLLRKGEAESIPLNALSRLPLAIQRLLDQSELHKTETRLRAEIDQVASSVGKSHKLVTIGRLAGSIAHEINNPLESITNLLYLAAQEPGLPEQALQYLRLAQAELERVVEISKQTLTFSREGASAAPVSLPSLLEEVLRLYARRVAEKRIRVQREYDPDARLVVHSGEMRQVFANLVSNALEAMEPEGTLRLRVRWSAQRGRGGQPGLRISVADTGAGIPAAARRCLGQPFFTTKGQSGTGLGLWVTQSIVARHGGSLKLRSRTGPGHGTVFTLFLPQTSPAAAETARGEGACLSIDRVASRQRHASAHSPAYEDRGGVGSRAG